MRRDRLSHWGGPALAAALPLLAQASRVAVAGRGIWLWGDQALIDIEARNSLRGQDLLGVYDRFGWHHPGPMWLLVLGVFRWLGGGTPAALVFGSYMVEVAAVVLVVFMAGRLRPGRTAWGVALLVLGMQLGLGAGRLGTVWAPYAVIFPVALLVLLLADAATSSKPWPAALGAAACASFLVQTDISTAVVVSVVAAAALATRLLVNLRRRTTLWVLPDLRWRLGAGTFAAAMAVAWLPPLVQQFSGRPGNLAEMARFFLSHPASHAWRASLAAMGTVFGAFPFGLGVPSAAHDSNPAWLLGGALWQRPWYLLYLLGTVAFGLVAVARRRAAAAMLAWLSTLAMLAAGLSAHLAYGTVFPYLIVWASVLAVPALLAWWLAVAPERGEYAPGNEGGGLRWSTACHRAHLWVPLTAAICAVAVAALFVARPLPMTSVPSTLGRRAWEVVQGEVLRPGVRRIYVDIPAPPDMPDAAAIVDEALRRGLDVEVNSGALYFFDPSLSPGSYAQLKVLVCCGRRGSVQPPPGMSWRGLVGHESIYTEPVGYLVGLRSSGRRLTVTR